MNVFKHGRRRDGQIEKPTDIYETSVITDYEDTDGTYHHAEKEVTIQLRDGSLRDMKTVQQQSHPQTFSLCRTSNLSEVRTRVSAIVP